jgi:hypothetical protein
VGRGKGSSQSCEGGVPIPRELHEPQTFPNSSLPQTPPERQYSKKFFLGGC